MGWNSMLQKDMEDKELSEHGVNDVNHSWDEYPLLG
jgi:hypothetical protein